MNKNIRKLLHIFLRTLKHSVKIPMGEGSLTFVSHNVDLLLKNMVNFWENQIKEQSIFTFCIPYEGSFFLKCWNLNKNHSQNRHHQIIIRIDHRKKKKLSLCHSAQTELTTRHLLEVCSSRLENASDPSPGNTVTTSNFFFHFILFLF